MFRTKRSKVTFSIWHYFFFLQWCLCNRRWSKIYASQNLPSRRTTKSLTKGTMIKQAQTISFARAKVKTFLFPFWKNFRFNKIPESKQATATLKALQLHIQEISWWLTPTWLKSRNNFFTFQIFWPFYAFYIFLTFLHFTFFDHFTLLTRIIQLKLLNVITKWKRDKLSVSPKWTTVGAAQWDRGQRVQLFMGWNLSWLTSPE